MAKSVAAVADRVARSALTMSRYIRRIEALARAKQLTHREVELAYAGAFLAFYVELESSIEQLFMGLLVGRIAGRRSGRPLVSVRSPRVAAGIVRSDRPFVQWLPIKHTKSRARLFFARGRPFSAVSRADMGVLERARCIRNAIAHPGGQVLAIFRAQVVGGRALPPNQTRPAGYLRGIHSQDQTRFENVLGECVLVLKRICI